MREHTHIVIGADAIARTPAYVGVNIEIQDHADRTNLWDWLSDLGVTAARQFHPEQSIRRTLRRPPGTWGSISTQDDFNRFRQHVTADPLGGGIDWDNYRFDESLPWIGVPDHIAERMQRLGIRGVFSLGYGPAHFERPLVKPGVVGQVADNDIDWEAAASAYDYCFAVIYRLSTRYGACWFTMINEPENQRSFFHLPPETDELTWGDLFWSQETDPALVQAFTDSLAAQYGVLARITRQAMDDVRTLLDHELGQDLRLFGPTTVLWDALWQTSHPYLDALDFHHYHTEAMSFPKVLNAAATKAQAAGKSLAISEFNAMSGGVDISNMLFGVQPSLRTAAILLELMRAAPVHGPALDFITLYLFGFPSTHRNFKHLVYGDMNTVDWSGQDRPLWYRGDGDTHVRVGDWYPTFEEQQLRFATPAFDMVRMLTRCVRDGQDKVGPFECLRVGLHNPSSSGPEDVAAQLDVLAVRQPDRLVITVLNTSDKPAPDTRLDLTALGDAPSSTCVLRQTTREHRDACLGWQAPGGAFEVPAHAMMQMILCDRDLTQAHDLELREDTTTPGSLKDGLSLWQTTRLRLLATVAGDRVDVTELGAVFASDRPDVVRCDGAGLVQRIRDVPGDVTITASLPNGESTNVTTGSVA